MLWPGIIFKGEGVTLNCVVDFCKGAGAAFCGISVAGGESGPTFGGLFAAGGHGGPYC